ncbi:MULTISPECIES: hypothetical protein [Pseudomonas]|uniref:hypothetical protein n=1 Tax=Pseudomonas TaxID=286 RepID=UPI002015EC7A|nr:MULTISPECIES: hypothetical protein [Pseudomonas]
MNDELSIGKVDVDDRARRHRGLEAGVLGMKRIVEQRDYLLRENQRLLLINATGSRS